MTPLDSGTGRETNLVGPARTGRETEMSASGRRNVAMAKLFLGLWWALGAVAPGCGAEAKQAEEHGEYPVTHPLQTDTEMTREDVAQVRAFQHIEVRALEGGYLEDLFADEGQPVRAGQPLFQIMPRV